MKYSMTFLEFLLLETQTISQYLKQKSVLDLFQKYAGTDLNLPKIKDNVAKVLLPFPEIQNNKKLYSVLFNYLVYQSLVVMQEYKPHINLTNVHTQANQILRNIVSLVLNNFHYDLSDYIISNATNNQLLSKLNTTTYTLDQLRSDVEDWHTALETNQSQPGREGRPIILLDSIGMKDWKWVSLDRKYCDIESKAAGHCGNAGYKDGDNILSLRDPENHVHLTFIVNKGILGESKGRNNTKPSKKYENAIMQLLLSPEIKSIKGGGYKPENNFQLKDLSKSNYELLLKHKPNIDYKNLAFNSGDLEALSDVLNTQLNSVTNGIIKVQEHEDFKDLYSTIKSKKVEDFSGFEDTDVFDWSSNIPLADLVDNLNRHMREKLYNHYDVDDDNDLVQAIKDDDDMSSIIHRANDEATAVGTNNEAYKDVVASLEKVTDNGFYIDFSDNLSIKLSLASAKKLYDKEPEEFNSNGLDYFYDFEFEQPYYGYSGFDTDAFNDYIDQEMSY